MKPPLELEGDGFRLRGWRSGDEPSLVRYANDREVWRNLTNRFPHPYTPRDAQDWIRRQESGGDHELAFAIDIEGEAVGGIGITPRDDLQVKVAEIGYWLGQPFWGRGIATAAVRLVTEFAFSRYDLVRICANVLEWNRASARVLEKTGYTCEARLRKNIFKDGHIIDSFLYAKLRD